MQLFALIPIRSLLPSPSARTPRRLATLGACLGLALITFAVFGQTTRFHFLNFDDDLFISENPKLAAGLSAKGIAWAFTANLTHNEPGAEYWEPLTLVSRLADVQLHGLSPGNHHLSNVLFHLAAGLVLFGALNTLLHSTPRSGVITALFLIHPLHVEAVAWLSARKDILNGLFFFATIWAYAWYAARPAWRRYLLVCVSFLCANMAKPMAVSLPLVLLLLDFWPLGRLKRPLIDRHSLRLGMEKIPLVVIASLVSLVAVIDQQRHGAMGDNVLYPLSIRLGNAVISYAAYLGQTFVPCGLSIFYPHPGNSLNWPLAAASAACCVLITGLCLVQARARPWLLVGWGWFVVVLLPVSGVIQIGEMARADRYTYVALVGIFVLCVQEAATSGSAWLFHSPSRWRTVIMASTAAAVIAVSGWLAWKQTGTWRDSISVFSQALAVTEDNYIAHINLGEALYAAGRKDEGLQHYREAIHLHSPVLDYHQRAGANAEERGDFQNAIYHYGKIVTFVPWSSPARQRLGGVLFKTGEYGKALVQYNEALRYDRNAIPPRLGIARVLIAQQRFLEARGLIEVIRRLEPANVEAHALLRSLPPA